MMVVFKCKLLFKNMHVPVHDQARSYWYMLNKGNDEKLNSPHALPVLIKLFFTCINVMVLL